MRRFRDQSGMSLVEVLVATAILAVALAPLLAAFMTSQKNVQGAATKVEAMALARSTMDEYLQQSYASLASTADWTTHSLNSEYQYNVTVEEAPGGYMKKIVVEVRWPESDGYRSVTLFSSVARRN